MAQFTSPTSALTSTPTAVTIETEQAASQPSAAMTSQPTLKELEFRFATKSAFDPEQAVAKFHRAIVGDRDPGPEDLLTIDVRAIQEIIKGCNREQIALLEDGLNQRFGYRIEGVINLLHGMDYVDTKHMLRTARSRQPDNGAKVNLDDLFSTPEAFHLAQDDIKISFNIIHWLKEQCTCWINDPQNNHHARPGNLLEALSISGSYTGANPRVAVKELVNCLEKLKRASERLDDLVTSRDRSISGRDALKIAQALDLGTKYSAIARTDMKAIYWARYHSFDQEPFIKQWTHKALHLLGSWEISGLTKVAQICTARTQLRVDRLTELLSLKPYSESAPADSVTPQSP